MLSDIVDVLADPIDGSPLSGADDMTRLVSESGHSYDVAKQGYVTLSGGSGLNHDGDSLEMVTSREAFLSRGHFAPFVEAVTEQVSHTLEATTADRPVVLEVGAGTGYYLSHTLDSIEGTRGVGLDISVPAAKRLAKSHPRVGAVVADVWDGLPLRDGAVNAITVIFAPRNPAEFARVMAPGAEVIALIAGRGHLDELREPLGILGVEEGKLERMIEQATPHLELADEPRSLSFPMLLDRESIAAQVGMSPSARHIDPETLSARVDALPEQMEATAHGLLVRLRRV